MLIWQPLVLLAYIALMPVLFAAWAAIEIKIHPNKYR